ncbi:Synj2bp-cox16 protein isoform 1 [Mus musculus]|uniref:Cytochrome c oxidase assembly protein COX16 homolog, mitochondrial n=2 Tax=Mus TaxID=862507 RepID=E9PVN6_MOUSE|nr:Synj2bp-cox16 protein isoform 1 [Mus musculus]XP_029340443.1 synaptojanin-2-binding protein isoform X1 [Mus caroli]|eukprot:NP_001296776.1 Synj2bp-cox16 protein isoform 1 [Mus musculus]
MNGRVDYLVTEEEINLTRGPSGLGFNIVGGTDQQYVSNDSGIYVSRIKEDGAAAQDGRLQEGDKILSVNGQDLKNLLHQDAVDLFRNAGCAVSLRVQHRLLVVGGSFGLREFSQIRYDAVTIKIDPELEKKLKVNKITLESEYEKIKDSTFENWKNIRGPRPWEDPQLLQGRNPETLKPKTT